MATVPHHTAPMPEPGAIELVEATGDGLAAGGLVLMSFLGAIPGLLPVTALTIAAGAILLIPALVLGLVVGVLWAIAVLIVRLARRLAVILAPRPVNGNSLRRLRSDVPTLAEPADVSEAHGC